MFEIDPQRLRQFLFDHVESHEQLQVLIWFHRNQGAVATEEPIARAMGISPPLVAEALERLTTLGLLSRETPAQAGFRYTPTEPGVHETLQGVIALYDESPLKVLQFMTTNAIERVRSSALKTFSDAFRLRKPRG